MSIKGIDSQIMITRSPDFAKDNSAMMQRPEVNQQILAEQQRILVEQAQNRVNQTEEAEMEGIRTEEDGGNEAEYDSNEKKRKKPQEEEKDERGNPLFLVPPGNNILDIRI